MSLTKAYVGVLLRIWCVSWDKEINAETGRSLIIFEKSMVIERIEYSLEPIV